VIRLVSGTRIRVTAPGQLRPYDDERGQFTDSRGRWMWIAYREIAALEFKEQPLIPLAEF
jgi:hypothetical protein